MPCEHRRRRSRCKECGGASICEHGRQRCRCMECGGGGLCKHRRVRSKCKECGGSSICLHGRVRSTCKECGGASMCEHGRQRYQCTMCGGTGICEHGRRHSRCKDCGGVSICEHGRERSKCKECGGSSMCKHGRQRYQCKDCGGGGICEHGRQRSHCKEEVCRTRLEVWRERVASYLHIRPPASVVCADASSRQRLMPPSIQRRACKRQRGICDDSDDDEGTELVMHIYELAMAERGARQQVQMNTASRAVTSSAEAAPGPSSEATWPDVEAVQRCPICMDGCDGEPRGRPDPREHMRGWGYTSCCGSSFHFECLSTWLLDKDTVDSTCGPVSLPSSCPHCRSNRLAPTSSRMLQGTKR